MYARTRSIGRFAAAAALFAAAVSQAYALNPQPLPPGGLTASSALVARALNPQPLPSAAVVAIRALNPQPLPPRRFGWHRIVHPPVARIDTVTSGARIRF